MVRSLVFVPSFYTIMDDASLAVAGLWGRLMRPNPADEPSAERGGATLHALSRPSHELPIAAE